VQSASRNVGAGLGALTVTTVSALVAPDFGLAYPFAANSPVPVDR
jgi:hypothetical protein